MDAFLVMLIFACVFGVIGKALGKPKGRETEGFLLGFFFSLLGLVIIHFLEPEKKAWKKSAGYRGKGSLAGPGDGQRVWEAQGRKVFLDPIEEAEFREWQLQRARGHNVPAPSFMTAPGLKVPENWEERQQELAAEEADLDQRYRQ